MHSAPRKLLLISACAVQLLGVGTWLYLAAGDAPPLRYTWERKVTVYWSHSIAPFYAHARTGGGAFLASGHGDFYAVDGDGALLASAQAGPDQGQYQGLVPLPDGGALLGNAGNQVTRLGPDGQTLWQYSYTFHNPQEQAEKELGYRIWPLAQEDGVTLVQGSDGRILALDERGSLLYTFEQHDRKPLDQAMLTHDSIYLASEHDELQVLSRATGARRWGIPSLPYRSQLVLDDAGVLYVPNMPGGVSALSPDGHELWRYNSTDDCSVAAMPGGGCAVLDGRRLVRLDSHGAVLWRVKVSGRGVFSPIETPSIAVAGRQIVVLSYDSHWLEGQAYRWHGSRREEQPCVLSSYSLDGKLHWRGKVRGMSGLFQGLGPQGEVYLLRYGRVLKHNNYCNTSEAFICRVAAQ